MFKLPHLMKPTTVFVQSQCRRREGIDVTLLKAFTKTQNTCTWFFTPNGMKDKTGGQVSMTSYCSQPQTLTFTLYFQFSFKSRPESLHDLTWCLFLYCLCSFCSDACKTSSQCRTDLPRVTISPSVHPLPLLYLQ